MFCGDMSLLPPVKMIKREEEKSQQGKFDEYEDKGPSNPMEIDVVVENIFKYTRFKDLSNCRLVCKKWYHLSVSPWLNAAPVKVLASPSKITNEEERKNDLSHFLSTVQNDFHTYAPYEYNGLRMFRRFRLPYGFDLTKKFSLCSLFYNKCGPYITELEINCTFPDLSTCQAIVLSKLTPNLKKIKGHVYLDGSIILGPNDWDNLVEIEEENHHDKLESFRLSFGDKADSKPFPLEGWMKIFEHYKNLRDLRQRGDYVGGTINFRRIVKAAIATREDMSGLSKLKSMDLRISKYPESISSQVELFRKTSVALEELHITFPRKGNSSKESILDLMRCQAATLKKLTIYSPATMFKSFEPPRMDFVHTLKITGFAFMGLGFLKGFPNLKKLDVREFASYRNDDDVKVFGEIKDNELDGFVMQSLTTFYCDYSGFPKTSEFVADDIQKLFRCMPFLKELSLFLTNDSFQELCKCWTNLEHLEMLGPRVDDDAFIGRRDNETGLDPNITWLKELKSFRQLENHKLGGGSFANLTEVSVECGLLKLPYLIKLEMYLSPEFDKDLLQKLNEKVSDLTIALGSPWDGSDPYDRFFVW